MIDLTPALNVPRSAVVAAIITALVLILVLAVLRLIDSDPKLVAIVVGTAIVLSVLAYVSRGALQFDAKSVQRLVRRSGSETLEITRSPGAWQATGLHHVQRSKRCKERLQCARII